MDDIDMNVAKILQYPLIKIVIFDLFGQPSQNFVV